MKGKSDLRQSLRVEVNFYSSARKKNTSIAVRFCLFKLFEIHLDYMVNVNELHRNLYFYGVYHFSNSQ